MGRAIDRRIYFWGEDGEHTGWVSFGEGQGKGIEVGTIAHVGVPNLTYEEGAQTLHLVDHPTKKLIYPC